MYIVHILREQEMHFYFFFAKLFFFCFSFFFFLSINWILNADFSLIRVRRVYICLVTSKTIRFHRKTPLYSEAFSQAIRAYAVRLKLNIYVYFVYLLLCIHAKHRRGKKYDEYTFVSFFLVHSKFCVRRKYRNEINDGK